MARKAEAQGYSTLVISDHLHNQIGPVSALVAAADATTTLRVGRFAQRQRSKSADAQPLAQALDSSGRLNSRSFGRYNEPQVDKPTQYLL